MRKTLVKKSFALALGLCLVLGNLAGCGSKNMALESDDLSAESIIEDMFNYDMTTLEGVLEFSYCGEFKNYYDEFDPDYQTDDPYYVEDFTYLIEYKMDEDTTYAKRNTKVGADEYEMSEEQYAQIIDRGCAIYEKWFDWECDVFVDYHVKESFKKVLTNPQEYDSLSVSKNGSDYIVTGVIDFEKISKCAYGADELLFITSYIDLFADYLDEIKFDAIDRESLKLKIDYIYDKNKKLKSVELDPNLHMVNKILGEEGKFKNIEMKFTVTKLSNETIEVPADIIESTKDDFYYLEEEEEQEEINTSIEDNFGFPEESPQVTKTMANWWFKKDVIDALSFIDNYHYLSKSVANPDNLSVLEEAANMFNKYSFVELNKYIINNYEKLTDTEKRAAAFLIRDGYLSIDIVLDNLVLDDARELYYIMGDYFE